MSGSVYFDNGDSCKGKFFIQNIDTLGNWRERVIIKKCTDFNLDNQGNIYTDGLEGFNTQNELIIKKDCTHSNTTYFTGMKINSKNE